MKFNRKTLALMLIDSLLLNLAAVASFYLSRAGDIPVEYFRTYYHIAGAGTTIYLLIFSLFGLYSRIWKYASINELIAIFFAVSLGTSSVVLMVYFLVSMRYSNTVAVLFWLIAIFLIGGSRFLGRILQDTVFSVHIPGIPKRVLIIGAGDAGALAVRELKNSNYREGYPVGIIDDAPKKQNLKLMGIPVLGTRKDIPRVIKSRSVEEAIIAMPSAPSDVIKEFTKICEKSGVVIKIMPGIYNFFSGQADTLKIHQVQDDEFGNSRRLSGIMN